MGLVLIAMYPPVQSWKSQALATRNILPEPAICRKTDVWSHLELQVPIILQWCIYLDIRPSNKMQLLLEEQGINKNTCYISFHDCIGDQDIFPNLGRLVG